MKNKFVSIPYLLSDKSSTMDLIESKQLSNEIFESYLESEGIYFKYYEFVNFLHLYNKLKENHNMENLMKNICFGYTIPQISKEFDTLQFFEDRIVNIELKSNNGETELPLKRIEEQLKKNKHYLNVFSDKKIHLYTFDDYRKKLFQLKDNKLEEVDLDILYNDLNNEYDNKVVDIDKLFDPSKYLVSPFNDPKIFNDGNYFLTDEQSEKKTEMLKKKSQLNLIEGSAGTGKTVLVYDIAKYFIENNFNVYIIHCANLNEGQNILNKICKYHILSVKDFFKDFFDKLSYSQNDIFIFDECQRLYMPQIDKLLTKFNSKSKFIFSGDPEQVLSDAEANSFGYLKNNFIKRNLKCEKIKLNGKIRTNKNISDFIKCLFNKNIGKGKSSNFDNIKFNYFNNEDDAIRYIRQKDKFTFINYTPEYRENAHIAIDKSLVSHEIIGQEMDNVLVAIDSEFYYDKQNGKLTYPHRYYNNTKMLFENLTRAKKNIEIVIINNLEILKRILDLLNA